MTTAVPTRFSDHEIALLDATPQLAEDDDLALANAIALTEAEPW